MARYMRREEEWILRQGLVNLLEQGYRLINPHGSDITAEFLKFAKEEGAR